MKTILFFASASRHSCRKRLDGVFRYFAGGPYRVQVIERNYQEVPVRKLLTFWKPVGCIAECGSGADELKPAAFGKIPVVYLDLDPQSSKNVAYAILPDCRGSGEMAARELLQLGAENFGFVGYPKPYYWSVDRQGAFAEALELNGRKCHVFHDRAKGDSFKRFVALREWLAALPKPCAVFTAMDPVSEEVLGACADLKLSVPEDIMLLGVDNDEEICEHARPTLSSLCPDFEQAGYLAAELLAARLANPRLRPQVRTFSILGVVHRQSTHVYKRRDARVMRAVEYVRQKACTGIRVADVAQAMSCSLRLAQLRYREVTGQTIKQAIDETRIERAKALLRTRGETGGQIAARCGFADESTLRKAFRRSVGMSMRDWKTRI